MRSVILVSLLGLFLGCGGPKAGDTCSQAGLLCEDTDSALECRLGRWTSLPCRGPKGCYDAGDKLTGCDLEGNLEGDYCASAAEGTGLCSPAGDALLQCRSGVYVKVSSCTSCTATSAATLSCQP